MANVPTAKNSDAKAGYSLVAVLVFCLILLPVIASFAQSARTSARTTYNSFERHRLEFLATGLADAVAFRVAADRQLYRNISDKNLLCRYGDLTAYFALEDHDGKIDINNAGAILLRAGFRAGGASDQNAETLQQYTEAYRSGQALPAGIPDISSLPNLKGAAFERVEEIYDAIAALRLPSVDLTRIFTVYRKSGNVELETAPLALQEQLRDNPATKEFTAADNGTFELVDVIVALVTRNGLKAGAKKTYHGAADGRLQIIARDYGISKDVVERLANGSADDQCTRLLGLKPGVVDGA